MRGGDDSASSPIGRVTATLDQVRHLKVIEQVGHDRAVNTEMLGEGELTANRALGGSGEHLVAPGSAGQVSDSCVRGLDVGPKDHAQAPAEVVGQRLVVAQFVLVTVDVVHLVSIRAEAK